MRLYAAVVAGIAWFALTLRFYLSAQLSLAAGATLLHAAWMYFAYFTILTNLLVALVLSWPLVAPASRTGRFCARSGTIAGVAVNAALVGIVYNVLLRTLWNPQGAAFLADVLLHDAVPILVVAYSCINPALGRVGYAPRVRWALWPIAYFVYTLLRGAASGFYPYPFIDAGHLGYARVFGNGLAILAGYFVVAALLFALDRLSARRVAQT